ncbi:hypothetical protein BGX31_001205 [Mortierella sp. GBA43]|nr:hypothetical protein BGX31_001205 [Mortierella sp. GBA43]
MIPELLQLAGAWGVFGLMGVDRDAFAMLVTILALALCLSTAALFPIDIFLVSRIMDPTTGLRYDWATDEVITRMQFSVKVVYYVAYSLIASFCFFWIPLSYFYFEELGDEDQTLIQRLWASFKYTFFFVLVACILLLTGLLMKPNRHEGIDLEWLRRILADLAGNGASAVAFLAGILALAGMGVLALYTAPGLSLVPLHLIAGSKSVAGKSTEARVQLAANRERQNTILSRYQHGSRPTGHSVLSDRDRQAISELAQEELLLEHRARYAQRLRDSWFHRCQWFIRPFEVILGVASASLSMLLVGSMLATTIGHTKDDICGAPCGYIFSGNLPNPLNIAFLKLSPYFPIDYVLIVAIILYMFWATTKGIVSIGIRVLWINLYKFRRAATQPQGLLAATMLLMLSLAGLSYSMTIAITLFPSLANGVAIKILHLSYPATLVLLLDFVSRQ